MMPRIRSFTDFMVEASGRPTGNFTSLHAIMSGNTLLARTAEPHWRFLRRAMGEVLRRATLPREFWRQHAEIVEAIADGNTDRAEMLIIDHGLATAKTLQAALEACAADGQRPDTERRSMK